MCLKELTVSSQSIVEPIISDHSDLPIEQSSLPQLLTESISFPQQVTSRTSQISRFRPAWWHDYDASNNPVGKVLTVHSLPSKFDISHDIHYNNFDPSHQSFIANATHIKEPTHFSQSANDLQWLNAVNKELDALELNDTWTLVELPQGKTLVGCKWVYKVKYKANGDVDKYKTRLVANGYTQSKGIDYHDTFAPVAKMVTVKCILAIAAARGW